MFEINCVSVHIGTTRAVGYHQPLNKGKNMHTKKTNKKLAVSLLALVTLLTFLVLCTAEDLEPTSGIPLTALQIPSLPFEINESGSYYLTENLNHTSVDTSAIQINADNVTIDLAGYSIIGPGSSSGTGNNGIYMNGRKNVEIRNGTITNFGNNGIWEENTGNIATGHRIIGVRVLANGNAGISLNSKKNIIKDCTISDNSFSSSDSGSGIICYDASIITDNVIYNNSYYSGIIATNGCIISGNNISKNGFGIRTFHGCSIIGNSCYRNGDCGILALGNGNVIKGNTLLENVINGIGVEGTFNTIEENVVTYCKVGINFLNSQNFYANNRVMYNATNYNGAIPTGLGDGGGNIEFGILPIESVSAEVGIYNVQAVTDIAASS